MKTEPAWLETLGKKLLDPGATSEEGKPPIVGMDGLQPAPSQNGDDHESRPRKSQATRLVELASDIELFRTPDHEAFATFKVGDHQETSAIKSKAVRRLLQRRFYEGTKTAAGSQAVQDAIGALEGTALFTGEEHRVHVRVAEQDGKIFLDLADDAWRVIEVAANGWTVRASNEVPVKFRRPRGMLPLPIPEAGGTLEDLKALLNIDRGDWILLKAWLIAALRPRGPYCPLVLQGEQGSGKSWVARMLRGLVDPNKASLRSEPKDPHDLIISATNAWVISLDNMGHIEPWLSDCLCRLATGGGFATRELYTDDDEAIFDAQRPILLNGIEDIVSRGDLLDRAIILQIPVIPDRQRKSEEAMWADFDRVKPSILGALLDAVAGALRTLPGIRTTEAMRMADFCYWSLAAEAAGAWELGAFLPAYRGNRGAANQTALDASVVASVLQRLMESRTAWCGTASTLLDELATRAGEGAKGKSWPKTPRGLSGHLRRLAPNLRATGLEVLFEREPHTGRRVVRLERGGIGPSPPSPPSPRPEIGQFRVTMGDANGDGGDANGGTERPVSACGDGGDANHPLFSKEPAEEVFDL